MREQELLKTFYALSDPIRLKIVKMVINSGEVCVCSFVEYFNISQPRISFHLRILKDANILKARKEGKWVYYSITKENEVINRVIDIIDKNVKTNNYSTFCGVKDG